MRKDYICIDLGSDRTRVYSSKDDDIVFDEPTCIALERDKDKIKDIGYLAEQIEGKTLYTYKVIRPIRHGIIIDDDALYIFLKEIFHRLGYDRKNSAMNLVFAVPSLSGKVNRKVLVDIAKRLDAKEIYIESEAKMASYGIGESVFSPTATLVLDIGAGISDVALISLGDIVSCDSTTIAGDTFNEAIRRYMIQKQHLNIGLKSAEYIKLRVGNVYPLNETRLVEVKGRDTITSLPSSVVVSSGEIRNVLVPLIEYIYLKVTDVISTVPPELAADLKKRGLVLTGGSALLVGLKECLQDKLSIQVNVLTRPSLAVVEGFRTYVTRMNQNR